MDIVEILEQLEQETGIDVADMMVVTQPRAKVLRELGNGDGRLYVVTDQLTCTRCGRRWEMRGNTPPKFCPGCNSPYWDKPKIVASQNRTRTIMR